MAQIDLECCLSFVPSQRKRAGTRRVVTDVFEEGLCLDRHVPSAFVVQDSVSSLILLFAWANRHSARIVIPVQESVLIRILSRHQFDCYGAQIQSPRKANRDVGRLSLKGTYTSLWDKCESHARS